MKKTSTGLDENVAGLLCYVLGWLSGLVFLLIEKENRFVRFHAIQSCIIFGILTVILIIFSFIPSIFGTILVIIIWILSFLLWIFLMFRAYQGQRYKVVWVGEYVDKQVGHDTAAGADSAQALRSLAELRDEGVLTDEEYEQKKSQIERDAATAEKIKKLDELRDEGILTDEEYEQKKNAILKGSG